MRTLIIKVKGRYQKILNGGTIMPQAIEWPPRKNSI
jgi:hypothetical protein